MHARVTAFVKRHKLKPETQLELCVLLEELIASSLEAGHSVAAFPPDSSDDTMYASGEAFDVTLPSVEVAAVEQAAGAKGVARQESGRSSFDDEETYILPDRAAIPKTRQESSSASAKRSSSVLRTLGVLSTPEQRYVELGVLGTGGMGRVLRVRDRQLNRVVAMKRLKPELMDHTDLFSRFVEEAQATSQLQHPGIVPVYEMGQYASGDLFFTMKEIKGRTLTDVIREAHRALREQHRGEEAVGRFGFRGLIDTFHRICETVAYAHNRGVLHRDLKPDNVMLGEHGEVLVVDWGLVKLTEEDVVTERSSSQDDIHATQVGVIKGTPAYMSPEQARGASDQIGPHSDVYALGTILYEILSGHPPIGGETVPHVLARVILGEIPPPGPLDNPSMTLPGTRWDGSFRDRNESLDGLLLPATLVQICDRALALQPEERFANAGELAHEIGRWLEGAQQRERGLAVVNTARELFPKMKRLYYEAELLTQQAEVMLEAIDSWESEEKKTPAWEKQEQAQQKLREAKLLELETEQLLQGALTHTPDLMEAHLALSDIYEHMHHRAEAVGDEEGVIRSEQRLVSHMEALPRDHPRRLSHAAYLKGDGAVSLVTEPPGATVKLYRFVKRYRRLVPEFVRELGQTPLHEVTLPLGSYLLTLHKEGYEDTHYPVCIGRQEHWNGVPPQQHEAQPIRLLQAGMLSPGTRYIPAGWFIAGGDGKARGSFTKQRVWIDAFLIHQFPVTHRDYLTFLNALLQAGREEEALLRTPKRRGTGGTPDRLLYTRNKAGLFVLSQQEDPLPYLPDQPVVLVSWNDAEAYADWLSQATGQSWRLPCELEWEKAARGVDGRPFPWGDFLDPSWCCMSMSHVNGSKQLQLVDSFPVDESPYGVRGMAGNVRDWCVDIYHPDGPPLQHGRLREIHHPQEDTPDTFTQRVIRGGSWVDDENITRTAFRSWRGAGFRNSYLSLRLVRVDV